ncbi:hypothetical protein CASFOL_006502 [Castilleja foliolosa]|uniref:AP2/ERF domain-containing protein n=2 Tax=Magnoliopsida TaxID=3398 RepID=A0ABD3E7H5_9LAMI
MSSINSNWLLGYSLSPQHHQDHHSQNPASLDSLHQDASNFAIFEAFNTNPDQDWNMKEMNYMNSFTCTNQNPDQNQETPKLEDFLGHDNNNINEATIYQTNNNIYSNNMYQEPINNGSNNITTTMGMSMIKNWLRKNQAPDNEAAPPQVAAAAAGGGGQSLSLSMSTGSSDNKLQSGAIIDQPVPKKSTDSTFGQRTSIYRGVTRHRWTGRYEAHLWDNSSRREGQTRKGRQIYLGGYDKEEKAARSYDLAALKYWGTATTTNFPISNYEKEIEEMKPMTRQEYVASIRRKSTGFSRGASIYRGVTRHHQHGRWQARIGRVAGNKDLYLGTFSTQEEAAEAYDVAAIKFRGLNAVTNFEINRYDVKSILASPSLPIGGAAKRIKDAENAEIALQMHLQANKQSLNLQLPDDDHNMNSNTHLWPTTFYNPYSQQSRVWCKQEQDCDEINNKYNHNLMSLDCNNQMIGTTMIVDDQNLTSGYVGSDDQGLFGSSLADYHQHTRSLYYQPDQQLSSNNYDQGSDCNNWVSSGHVPNLASMWRDA